MAYSEISLNELAPNQPLTSALMVKFKTGLDAAHTAHGGALFSGVGNGVQVSGGQGTLNHTWNIPTGVQQFRAWLIQSRAIHPTTIPDVPDAAPEGTEYLPRRMAVMDLAAGASRTSLDITTDLGGMGVHGTPLGFFSGNTSVGNFRLSRSSLLNTITEDTPGLIYYGAVPSNQDVAIRMMPALYNLLVWDFSYTVQPSQGDPYEVHPFQSGTPPHAGSFQNGLVGPGIVYLEW